MLWLFDSPFKYVVFVFALFGFGIHDSAPFLFSFFQCFFFFQSVNQDWTKYNINTPIVPSNQVSLLNFLIDIKSRAAPLAHNQLYITEIWKAKEVTDRGNKVLHYFVEKKACTVLGGCNRWQSDFEKSRTWVGQDTFIN